MSRILRRQLFSIAELLEKANKILEKKLFGPGMDEQAIIELVTDCQDSAISMGEQIEKMYGEGTASVGILEQYCENLYLLTISLQDAIKRRELYNTLNKQLKKLRGVMNSELPDKLEVVFLPYKASMWDSLESIWMAADIDKDCEAYVIPIPYYDRNMDGSMGKLHYEVDMYPDYVPVINYKQFDFGKHHPDIIYIHNPYDNCNLVTSVHPFFYSNNLLKYTDKLVYVPYFILDEPNCDDIDSLQSVSHFVTVPAVLYANVVVLQSENMRKAYIKVLTDTYGMESRAVWENKIYGIGSPKVDKILSARREDYI